MTDQELLDLLETLESRILNGYSPRPYQGVWGREASCPIHS